MSLLDSLRRAQGALLALSGLGSAECRHRTLASGTFWRLRAYEGGGDGPAVLIVAAPIKQPYVWDLAPSVSAVRRLLGHGCRVFLLEWMPASHRTADAGLAAYAGEAIGTAVAAVTGETGGKPFLMGHSLGGTFSAIHTALAPESVRGLVLAGAPLCFAPGSSRFRDAIVDYMPKSVGTIEVVPGTLLTQVCSAAAPDIFVWARATDAARSIADPAAALVHARVERWALDELPLSGALVREIFRDLYHGDRFHGGTLDIAGERLAPWRLRLPTLAIANTADDIAPPGSIAPFVESMPPDRARLIVHDGEHGVGLQHLAVLVGRKAHAEVWPGILAWLDAQA